MDIAVVALELVLAGETVVAAVFASKARTWYNDCPEYVA